MYLWLKILHIGAVSLWFAGLVFLPRLIEAHRRESSSQDAQTHYNRLANTLYFRVLTPAALIAVALGTVLMVFGPFGAWLVLKLSLVAMAVVLHVYFGWVLHEIGLGRQSDSGVIRRSLGWLPLILLLGLAALTGAKPLTVAPMPPPPAVGLR